MYSRTKPTVCVVHWPDHGVIKAGYGERQRWRPFVLRGAEVVDLIEFDTSTDAFAFETVVLDMLESLCAPAFVSASESVALLGNSGSGHLECYLLPSGISPMELLCNANWAGGSISA